MARRLMELDSDARCGAGHDKKNPQQRIDTGIGRHESAWDTRPAVFPGRAQAAQRQLLPEFLESRCMVSAATGTVFVQDTPEAAQSQWRSVPNLLPEKFPHLPALMDGAEHDVLAFMTFPRARWT